jgi:hypothetical protein
MINRINSMAHEKEGLGTRRMWLLAGTTGAAVLATLLLPRIPQPQSYHRFADTREFLDIPNAANVLSNAGFLLVGVPGMLSLLRRNGRPRLVNPQEKWPYFAFFAAIALATFGSGYYHLAPDNDRLFWDRLPIGLAAGAIVAGVFGDRVGARAGNTALVPLLALGAASAAHWIHSEHVGHGDLRFYGFMQGYPAVIIPVLILTTGARYTRTSSLLTAGGFYVLAKLGEVLDKPIFSIGSVVSGHTLKHVFAAGAAYAIFRMLMKRDVVSHAGKRQEVQPALARVAGGQHSTE